MKITKVFILREGHYPSEDKLTYEAVIEYSTYAKRFYIRIPEKISTFKCRDESDQNRLVKRVHLRSDGFWAYADVTEEGTVAMAREHLSLFAAEKPDTRKVILYQFRYATGDIRRSQESSAGGHLASGSAVELATDYIVCYETTHGSHKSYERRTEVDGQIKRNCITGLTYSGYLSNRAPDYFVMGWTEKREDYFKRLSQEMAALIERINEFVRDEVTFTALVDSGGQNLLTEGKEK